MVSVSPQGEQAPTKTILKPLMARKFTFYSFQTLVATWVFFPLCDLEHLKTGQWKCLKNVLLCFICDLYGLFFSAQLSRVSRPRLAGLPPEWHLHRSVKLLCSPPGHRWETCLLVTHLPFRVSAIIKCSFTGFLLKGLQSEVINQQQGKFNPLTTISS